MLNFETELAAAVEELSLWDRELATGEKSLNLSTGIKVIQLKVCGDNTRYLSNDWNKNWK